MINVILRVTPKKDGLLEVDESGHANEIGKGGATITWRLRRSCPDRGSFNSICDPSHPGFSWIKPQHNVFEQAELEHPGNKIKIKDKHCDEHLPQEYEYRLCATINGKPYSTEVSLHGGSGRNPKIRQSNPKIKNV
jgi:hypothetical protein